MVSEGTSREPIIYDKAALGGISADLYNIKYPLWRPFASMARLAETAVHTLQVVSELVFDASRVQFTGENWFYPLNYLLGSLRTKSIQ